jgi:hypothetical protein
MDPPSEVCARTSSILPCPAAPESPRSAAPFGSCRAVRRTGMWFTWSSGAYGSFVPHPPLAAGRGTCCRSSDPRPPMPREFAPGHGPRHASTSTGATCGGKNSGRSCGSLAVHCCPPRPSNTSPRSGPRGPSTGPLACVCTQVRATLLTLTPTFPTRSGPCDPAAKPGFLSWGCPKIRPSIV